MIKIQLDNVADYYKRSEVSNSTLGAVKRAIYGGTFVPPDVLEKAFDFGKKFDCLITQPHNMEVCTSDEIDLLLRMKAKLEANETYQRLTAFNNNSNYQCAYINNLTFNIDDIEVTIPSRVLVDIDPLSNIKCDLKTTSATSDKQFKHSFYELCYYRQASWYMDTSECDKFVFIGVSKKGDNNVFVHTITRGDNDYLKGKEEYEELCFYIWLFFSPKAKSMRKDLNRMYQNGYDFDLSIRKERYLLTAIQNYNKLKSLF